MTVDEMLAAALRDLCGDAEGMVWIEGELFRRVTEADDVCTPERLREIGCLPALDSPANWGHWLARIDDMLGGVSLKRSGKWWVAETECGSLWSAEHETPPAALLEILCRASGPVHPNGTWPPSVLAWWKEHGQ